ncbi:RNA ligase family protein [Streptomyces sp. NPDC058947]|uniref:RNA ligase family protein n=1 Tax=Streptomyces sp. NPDC058947 TaxID=3346675 RepID=UPI00368FD644
MLVLARKFLPTINTATKYPEIPTYHTLGERGRLTDEVTTFDGPVILSEKVDGTNIRIIKEPGGDWIIGSREDLLTARGDRVANKFEGVVEALGDLPEILPAPFENVRVYYLEVYGGRITGKAKNYSKSGATGFRIFDVAHVVPDIFLTDRETASIWRKNGGQKWMPWDQVQALVGGLDGVEMVPEVGRCHSVDLPTGHQNTLDWLERMAPKTLCGLTEQGPAEGIVLRSPDRSRIAKARFQDYRRTLGIK